MDNSSSVLACPLCFNQFAHASKADNTRTPVFGYGLDFRLVPRDSNRWADVTTCPNCLFSFRVDDIHKRVPGHVRELVRTQKYTAILKSSRGEALQTRSWVALVTVLGSAGVNPRDLGMISLKGAWVARELSSVDTEEDLLALADAHLDDALRRGLTKGNPGMIMYLLGEINRRRGEFLRAREMLTFLGNNPRYRYAALLQTVLIEEQDTTPYWSRHAPDQMEQNSARFKGLFPALRSIPAGKTEFYPEELSETSERPEST